MDYNSALQNININACVYTPYMIKPSNGNTYVSFIDLLNFGDITDFGYLEGYSSFNVYMGKFYSFDS